MRKRWLALWLVICIVFMSVPVDGLRIVIRANTVAGPEKTTEGEISIPETVSANGMVYRVTGVKYQAFYGCEALEEVVLPEGLL